MHSPSRAGPTLTPWCLGRGKKSRKKRRQSRDSGSRETRPASESAAEPTATPERREGRGKRAVAPPTPWPAQLQAVKGADWEGLLASGWAPLGALLLAISVRSIAELVW